MLLPKTNIQDKFMDKTNMSTLFTKNETKFDHTDQKSQWFIFINSELKYYRHNVIEIYK